MWNCGKSTDCALHPEMHSYRPEGSRWPSCVSRWHGRDAWSAEMSAGMARLDRLQAGRSGGMSFA
jgi:hypothetical protein